MFLKDAADVKGCVVASDGCGLFEVDATCSDGPQDGGFGLCGKREGGNESVVVVDALILREAEVSKARYTVVIASHGESVGVSGDRSDFFASVVSKAFGPREVPVGLDAGQEDIGVGTRRF